MAKVLSVLRRHTKQPQQFRRGVYLLPSMFTVANMFCGYACIVYAMRGEYGMAAPFIGIAMVLDMLDGRIARLTGASSAFGHEFDSLADVISFGLAPAILVFSWGLEPLGRLGWTASFLYVTAAAMRLARFNIQSAATDKRYFVGMPSPAAAGVLASSVFAYPSGLNDYRPALLALAVVLIPAFLMVSTIRFRNFKRVQSGPTTLLHHADPDRRGVGCHRDPSADRSGRHGVYLPDVGTCRRRDFPHAAALGVGCGTSGRGGGGCTGNRNA